MARRGRRRLGPRERGVEAGREQEGRERRPDWRESGDPVLDDPEIHSPPGDPTHDARPSTPRRIIEDLLEPVRAPTDEERIRDHDAQEWDEHAADHEQERLVSAANPLANG